MRRLVTMLCVLSGCSYFLSGRGSTDRHTIKVQDESGNPVSGAEVYAIESWVVKRFGKGSSPQRVHGPLRTNSQGKVRVKIGERSRVFYVAKYPGWPSQIATLASPKVIVLGPPRDLSGEIVLPDGCPPGVVSVAASKYQQVDTDWAFTTHSVKPVAATIGADLRFNLPGLGPPPYSIVLRACGRVSWVVLAGGASSAKSIRLTLDKSLPDGDAKTQTSFALFRPIQLKERARTDQGAPLVPFEASVLWISPNGRRLVGGGSAEPRGEISTAFVAEDGKATTLDGFVRLLDGPPAIGAWAIGAPGRSAYYVWFPSERSPRRLAATCSVLTVRSASAVCGDYTDWQKPVLHLVQQDGPLTTLATDGGEFKLTDERLTYRAPKPGGEIVRDLLTGQEQHVPVEPHGIDQWVQKQLGPGRKIVSEDGRFAASAPSHGGNPVLVDLQLQKATTLPMRVNDRSLRFAGPWLLAVEVTEPGLAGDGFALRMDSGSIQKLAMGIEADQQALVVGNDLVVQRELSGGRVIAIRLSTGDVIALGKLNRFEVGTDGQWLVGYDDDQNAHVVRTDGSAKLSLGLGTAKLTQDGRGVLFKQGPVPDRGALELIDFEHATRMHVADGVRGFTSLGDGRVAYSSDRGPAGKGIYIQKP